VYSIRSKLVVRPRIAEPFLPFYDPLQQRGEVPLAREQRKLAAILAADVVGHCRLMGRDESCTPTRLRGIATTTRRHRSPGTAGGSSISATVPWSNSQAR
jgi:hypothetical protein